MLDLKTIEMREVVGKSLQVITANEIGGDQNLAYKFSDPDGVRTGKSGYSFGPVQFDVKHNWTGILCLRDCGFRPKHLARLFEQRGPIDDLNAKLQANKTIVDAYSAQHVGESCEHVLGLLRGSGIQLENMEALVHIVDYHNQFYMSPHGKIHRWLLAHKIVFTPQMVLSFKLTDTAWGRKRSDDVQRRYDNITKLFKADKED